MPTAASSTTAAPPWRGTLWLGFGLVGAALVLMIARAFLEANPPPASQKTAAPPPPALSRLQPLAAQPRYQLATAPLNPTLGTPGAGVHAVEILDLGCVACRATSAAQYQALAAQAGSNLWVTTKLVPSPQHANRTTAALFALLAHQQGDFAAYRARVEASTDDSIAFYSQVLEELGLPLRQQRRLLAQQQDRWLRHLNEDSQALRTVGLPLTPQVLVDGYVVPPDRLSDALSALAER